MILVDGVLHEGTVAPFDLSDRGFTLGDGLFETMVVFGGVVFRLDAHLDRLEAGLASSDSPCRAGASRPTSRRWPRARLPRAACSG